MTVIDEPHTIRQEESAAWEQVKAATTRQWALLEQYTEDGTPETFDAYMQAMENAIAAHDVWFEKFQQRAAL